VSTLEDKLKRAVEIGQATIFLNQQWIGHFRDTFEKAGLLEETLAGLIDHAKKENREAFYELGNLLKEDKEIKGVNPVHYCPICGWLEEGCNCSEC
jgi:rubrerythrin